MKRGIFDSVLIQHDEETIAGMLTGEYAVHDTDLQPMEQIPDGVAEGVPPDVYNSYRTGRDSACADIVIATKNPQGQWGVILSMRKLDVCFAGKWWHHAVAVLSYASLTEFVESRAEKECGVPIRARALLGVYRTSAIDYVGSTLQPCYAGIADYQEVAKKFGVDSGHVTVRIFTKDELATIPLEGRHWYPLHVADLLLRSIPATL